MMSLDRRSVLTGLLGMGVLGGAGALQGCDLLRKTPEDDSPIRMGWQTAWASQGQVMEALIKTNIPALVKAPLTFSGFQYGPDLNEAAISNSIDVTNAGIVPVINLLAKSADWAIIGRQTDFYVSIIAQQTAGIQTVADLRGKRLAVPIGGGSHPFAIAELRKAGLKEGDVKVVNVPPTEMLLAFKQGDVDAVAVWDPVAQLVIEAGGRIIAEQRYVGFITVNRKLLEERGPAVERMLEAYGLAYLYAARNKTQTDGWFAKDSGMPVDLVSRLRVAEPNLKTSSLEAVTLTPTEEALTLTQSVADTMVGLGLLTQKLDLRSRLALEPARKAEIAIERLGDRFTDIKPV